MLRHCKRHRLVFVNGVDEVRFFGAAPCSDRSGCVEDKKERESMLDSQNDWEGKRLKRCLSLGLSEYHSPLIQTRGRVLESRYYSEIIAPRPSLERNRSSESLGFTPLNPTRQQ